MAKIPNTGARIATTVTIRAIVGDVNVDTLNDAAALAALSTSSVKIGAIKSFSESTPRNTVPRYELDADNPGEIVERIPQLVDRTLTINRAVLFTGDMLAAFGFSDINDIIDQNVPFVIIKVEKAPTQSAIPDKTTVYQGCWFHDLPKEYSLEGDLLVMQNVTIGYTRKFSA